MFIIYHIYLHTGHEVSHPPPHNQFGIWKIRGYIIISRVNYCSSPVQSGCPLLFVYCSYGSSVGIVTILQTGWWRNCGLLPGRSRWFPQMCSHWLLGIHSLMFSRYWWLFLQGQNSWIVKMTTHLSLIPRLRVGGTILFFPHVHSQHAHGQLHLYLHVYLLYVSLRIV
jgi:hypothetical protein